MALSSTRRTQLLERLAKRKAQLATAEASYDSLISSEIESYNFNSGEGQQQVKRRKMSELENLISKIEADIDYITKTLNNTGVVNVNVRRYPGGISR